MSGIDLGMTNSVMAITEADEPTVLENRAGARLTPSIVAQRGEGLGEILVGQRAKSQGAQPEEYHLLDQAFDGLQIRGPRSATRRDDCLLKAFFEDLLSTGTLLTEKTTHMQNKTDRATNGGKIA